MGSRRDREWARLNETVTMPNGRTARRGDVELMMSYVQNRGVASYAGFGEDLRGAKAKETALKVWLFGEPTQEDKHITCNLKPGESWHGFRVPYENEDDHSAMAKVSRDPAVTLLTGGVMLLIGFVGFLALVALIPAAVAALFGAIPWSWVLVDLGATVLCNLTTASNNKALDEKKRRGIL